MHVSILGFGLIGGSIARSLRRTTSEQRSGRSDTEAEIGTATIAAWSPSHGGPRRALDDGVIDVAAPGIEEALVDADLVILAAPPLACLELLDRLGGPLRGRLPSAATVTDVASTKVAIVARAAQRRLRFVGGHPMAGRETAGYGAATAVLFVDRPWVIVAGSGADREDEERVEGLALVCGARPLHMSAAEHDRAAAAISHAPLVVAVALVEAIVGLAGVPDRPDWPASAALAASGWRDMTRLARGDVAMGAGIVATNAPEVVARLRDLRGVIDEWLVELQRDPAPDAARLEARFEAARARLERFGRVEADPR